MTIRVAMLAPEFLPVWGGIGTYIVELVKNFSKDIEVHVITPFRKKLGSSAVSSSDYNFEEMFGDNVHIHFLSTATDTFIYNAKFQLAVWRTLRKIIKGEDIDIIHSNAASMPDLLINPAKIGVPIVTTIHSTIKGQSSAIDKTNSRFFQLEFSEKMTQILRPLLLASENLYYTMKPRRYITVSKFSRIQVVKEMNLDPQNVEVIYNGVDPDRFNPKQKRVAKLYFENIYDIDTPKVLYLSRFIEKKGIGMLLKAMECILKRYDIHFILAGPGKEPDFDNYNIPKQNYTFLGYVHYEYTPFLYALSDIFILPSLYENFPISVLEAMASETAVIATKVGGIPEMISSGKNGILVFPKDKDKLTSALADLIENDSLRRKLSKNGRRTVIKKFNWKQTAKKTKEYYEEILKI